MTETPEEMKRGERTLSVLGQESTTLHRANSNTGERVTGAGILLLETLDHFYATNSSHGILFLLSITGEQACTENCPQTI